MPGRGGPGCDGIEGRGDCNFATKSGRGGTTGRATGCPASGRLPGCPGGAACGTAVPGAGRGDSGRRGM